MNSDEDSKMKRHSESVVAGRSYRHHWNMNGSGQTRYLDTNAARPLSYGSGLVACGGGSFLEPIK